MNYKIINHDKRAWLNLDYTFDEDADGFYKDLYCNYNELNPKLGFGTLFTDGISLLFYKSSNFTNQYINKDNFMQKIVDDEIKILIENKLIKEGEINEKI